MNISVFTIAFLLAMRFRQQSKNEITEDDKKLYLILAGLIFFLIASFRRFDVGPDTKSYIEDFKFIYLLDWKKAFFESKEPGYIVLTKLIRTFTSNELVYLSIYAGIITISICRFISKNSEDYCISFLMFISLNYFAFTIAGIRQSVAISIILWAYEYVKVRRLIPFLLLMALAYTFHNTSIIFIPIYFIAYSRVNFKQIILLGVASFLAIIGQQYIKSFLFDILGWERLANYENRTEILTMSGYYIKISILIFCLLFKKKLIAKDTNNKILFNCLYLGVSMQAFAIIIAEFFRISMYFSIFEIIIVSKIFKIIKDEKSRKITYIGIVFMLVSYYFLFGNEISYHFFWEM